MENVCEALQAAGGGALTLSRGGGAEGGPGPGPAWATGAVGCPVSWSGETSRRPGPLHSHKSWRSLSRVLPKTQVLQRQLELEAVPSLGNFCFPPLFLRVWGQGDLTGSLRTSEKEKKPNTPLLNCFVS